MVPIGRLSSQERWDTDYIWTPEERRELGLADKGLVTISDLIADLKNLTETLEESDRVISSIIPSNGHMQEISLSDTKKFRIHRGKRVTKKECENNRGEIIVIASGRHKDSYFGYISENYLQGKFRVKSNDLIPQLFSSARKILTVGATGAVGAVHLRDEELWYLHDDALAIEIIADDIDPQYCRFALQEAINQAQFAYSAKLYQKRLSSLKVEFPVHQNGDFDLDAQQQIAEAKIQRELMQKRVIEFSRVLQSQELSD